uniref:Uncharacterized protein n=1 Tax=Daphnia galeata TaxID=27404 RepID=A0A8J2SAE4_9CRUS|nr:unnamed protein product [Daphnia galeata]
MSLRRKLKIGTHTTMFLMLNYYAFMKNLSKRATLSTLMDNKRGIARRNLEEAHQTILEETKVKRKQKTLDEMFKKRVISNKKKYL